jgi:hypothetical protein
MTNPTHTTFDDAWQRYSAANKKCLTLSGRRLSTAQDQERDAIFDLTDTPGRDLDDVAKKLDALKYLLDIGEWTDSRELLLLDSIMRDVHTLARRAA